MTYLYFHQNEILILIYTISACKFVVRNSQSSFQNKVSIDFEGISISNETSKFIPSGILENETDFQKLLLLEVIDKLAYIEIDTYGNYKVISI